MLAGHYATALVANERLGVLEGNRINTSRLLYFLIASQLPDLLWVVFHFVGLEPTTPPSVLDTTLKTLTVDMVFSHDLIPSLFWTGVLYVVGRLWFRSSLIGLTGSCLLVVHILCDYAAGYPHHVCGVQSPSVGFAAYHSVPLVAVTFEAVFTAGALYLFFDGERKRGIRRTIGNVIAIVGLFAFNIVFMALIANTSLRERFVLGGVDNQLTALMPNMVVTYWGMLFFLLFTARVVQKASHRKNGQ